MGQAARSHLNRIISTERTRGASRINTVRVFASLAGFALAFGFGVVGGDAGYRDGTGPAFAYFAASVAVWLAVRRLPSLTQVAVFSPAVLDAPMVTLIMYAGAKGTTPGFELNGVALYCGVIAGSATLLSSRAVVLACVASLVGQAYLLVLVRAPPQEHVTASLAPVVTAAFCVFLVSRITALVVESRRDDLMGKYILGERLGVGGMAEVFRATYAPEGGFERQVAVKRVLPAYAQDLGFIARFRREAELTAQLVHPNVVQVLDFGQHNETWFLAMELVDGVPLSRLVAGPPLSLPIASYVALQLADALDFIHQRRGPDGQPLGLVHRDLNPPNVLVSKHGEVKVADFGVARALGGSESQLTASGMLIGKLTYLAPEQLRGEAYDGRADLFALGLTLYQLVAGRRATDETSEAGVIQALLAARFVPPSAVRAGVPAPLDALVLGLLEKDPGQRTSAAALRAQLLALTGPTADFTEGRRLLAVAVAEALATGPQVPPPPGELLKRIAADAPTAAGA